MLSNTCHLIFKFLVCRILAKNLCCFRVILVYLASIMSCKVDFPKTEELSSEKIMSRGEESVTILNDSDL